ncbi:MAG: carboxypeptidase-like regulatory domain-containing protein [Saprospiraceae bacterium]|nr:carboxypeptidase-like regulatory domain-containing protein [Saprospiraceae bacterium]
MRDRLSGEYLIGANVFLHDRQRGTSTNETGNYSLKIDKQRHRIHFSYLGYKSQIVEFNALKDSMLNISLQPDGLLNEIVIMDNLMEEVHEQPADQQNLHIDKIRSSNHLGGEADLFRYLASQPGISTAAEGVGGLNIRGGSADQNLVLLDEVPVYNTGHALGIFSIFNSDAIKSVSLYKGGIPARYAGRLSSVIDVHTRDGNFQNSRLTPI